jgi:squalene-hopene/tetraprenyl-beta-curcumene cyclase
VQVALDRDALHVDGRRAQVGVVKRVRGYTGSHPEVTAVVVRVLLKAGLDPAGEIIRRAVSYLKECQGPDGLWQSYWWDGQMYATYHCLRALKACGSHSGRQRGAAVAATILAGQGGDGSWGEKTAGKNQAFETALALGSLLTLGESSAAAALKRGGVWLLNHQAADGGFTSGPMMRVPDKDETEPWKREQWALDSVGGFGALGRDQNRLFTTSTVVSALTDYLRVAGDRGVVVSTRPGLGRPAVTEQNKSGARAAATQRR